MIGDRNRHEERVMKNVWASVVAGILVTGVAAAGEHPRNHGEEAQQTKVTPQTTCPVMGGKISKDLYVEHDGKRIYVCCPGCIGKIKADPAKYITKLEQAGVVLDAAAKPATD